MNSSLEPRHSPERGTDSGTVAESVARRLPWRRLRARQFQFLVDFCILSAAFVAAHLLRFEFRIPEDRLLTMLAQLPLVLLLQLGAMRLFRIHSFAWRYIGMADTTAFIKAAWWSFLPMVLLRLLLPVELAAWRIPLSICFLTTIFGFGGVHAARVLRRVVYEHDEKLHRDAAVGIGRSKPILLVGAGQAGVMAAKEIQARGDLHLDIKGFVDDGPTKQGLVIQGLRVLGQTRDLPRLVPRLGIDHVVITIAQAPRKDLRRIIEICESIPVKARIIPGLYEILGGTVEISRIRDVEIEDVLGREPVKLDEDVLEGFISGNTVMVTGAGGSIGSELCRQVARFRARTLLLVERAEFGLFEIDRELREANPDLTIVPLVADICDEDRMREVFRSFAPSVVIHAAAHKHVPLMESNPSEAVKNNILGTLLLGELAGEYGAESFIQVSTDKAVRPTSVMGASKRVAELMVQDLDHRYETRYVSVRFGNVLGSTGSVIPIFREQILRGGPVTVTHQDMIRYFMTIPEATQLVLEAGAIGKGGEIFVLDMGEPLRIFDLARDMITLFGLKPFEDIDIVFTGVRPGEKMFEELETAGEDLTKTRHPKIFIGTITGYPPEKIAAAKSRFREFAVNGKELELRDFFNEFLPEARLTE